MALSSDAISEEAPSPTSAPVNTDVPICLDFLKGRCTRNQCRFLHPDLSQYQQLSGAVQAQAGRHVCEVWAMTGTCKFGAKCSRLHPSLVFNPQPQPALTLLLPLAVMPQPVLMTPTQAPASPLLPPSPLLSAAAGSFGAVPPPSPFPASTAPATPPAPAPMSLLRTALPPSPPFAPLAPVAASAAVGPQFLPHHVSPPDPLQGEAARPPMGLQNLARSIQIAVKTGKRDPRAVVPISKGPTDGDAATEHGRSLACLFGADVQMPEPPAWAPFGSLGADASHEQMQLLTDPPHVTVQPPSAPKPPRRRPHNPQHDRDRVFLDMLRDLHNAGR